jgi:dihydroorotate dehydrogenase electron transfer subunit
MAGWVTCPPQAVPPAGQYLLAALPGGDQPLATRIFASAVERERFACVPGLPRTWLPGTQLELAGPLGHGFHLPETARQVVFAALGGRPAVLRPLIRAALETGCGVTLFADGLEGALERWPTALEVYPLDALSECLAWAEYLGCEASSAELGGLRARLGLPAGRRLPFPAEALVDTPVACGGVADCGVCAVRTRRGWKLACKDGPVFDLHDLEW